MSGNIQQQFIISRQADGTYTIEVPGAANGMRRRLDTSFGLAASISEELDRIEMERNQAAATAARIAAEAATQRHNRIVATAAKTNPATLRYIESGKTRKGHLIDGLRQQGYTQNQIELLNRHQQLRFSRANETKELAHGNLLRPSKGEGI